jgi:hypothetical protein
MDKLLRRLFRKLGYDLQKLNSGYPVDFASDQIEIITHVQPYTLTSPERIFSLIEATKYVVTAKIPGAFVECGVWKGGSIMAMAETLLQLGSVDREFFLFDTFEGMSEPSPKDVSYKGVIASELVKNVELSQWDVATLEEVKKAIYSTGYPQEKFHFVPGKVENTLPDKGPDTIALLRLDTDWYESTKHELIHLFPKLASGGVLIVDDYGHWQGARAAVDEYLSAGGVKILLNRIDYTGRIGIKVS